MRDVQLARRDRMLVALAAEAVRTADAAARSTSGRTWTSQLEHLAGEVADSTADEGDWPIFGAALSAANEFLDEELSKLPDRFEVWVPVVDAAEAAFVAAGEDRDAAFEAAEIAAASTAARSVAAAQSDALARARAVAAAAAGAARRARFCARRTATATLRRSPAAPRLVRHRRAARRSNSRRARSPGSRKADDPEPSEQRTRRGGRS